jgi:hypothetical protein
MGKLEVSQKRIDANRRNAMRSTGPKSAEGKEKSRRNSLVHGLAGAGVVVAEREMNALADRVAMWSASLCPVDAFEMGLVETIAVESLRIERCRVEEDLARDFRARRAGHCWGDERKAVVAKAARALGRRPAETAMVLASSAPGCDWLIDRWRMLGFALDKAGEWTDEQRNMALDMLGVAADLRDLETPIDAPEDLDAIQFRQALVDDQLERLIGRKEETLDDIEDDLREATALGYAVDLDPALTLIRRYEAASFRRMRWALDLLDKNRRPETAENLRQADESHQAEQGAASPASKTTSGSRPGADCAHSGRVHLSDAMRDPATPTAVAASVPIEATEGPGRAPEAGRKARKLRQVRARRQAAQAVLLSC